MNEPHPFRKRSEHTVTIHDVVFGGQGIARVDDFVIFVENTIPGDTVKISISKKKQNFAEAKVLEYIERGDGFVKAVCDYFGFCGGCKWQHLDYDHQLKYKQMQVADSIERLGKLKGIPVQATLGSAEQFAYRNKMEFSFSDNRWLLPSELGKMEITKDYALGLHVPGAFNKILDIRECHIQDEMFNTILTRVSDFVKTSDLPVYNLKSHEGVWRFLMLRKGVNTGEYMINVVTSEPVKQKTQAFFESLCQEFPQITSVVNNTSRRMAQVAIGEEEDIIVGANIIHEKLDDFKFEISANSFFQTNTKQAEVMYRLVKKLADSKKDKLIFDLYSGTGTIPIYLSDVADKVIGFELVESSVLNARDNVARLGIENCEFVCGDVKETLPAYKHMKPDILVVDPPRAGIHADVIETLLFLEAKSIIYVSCNPTTLARDLALLCKKYDVTFVQPLDMFPHTYHIETVVKLILKSEYV
jgi:23S rRNA (uracil1939-C5)-methyltransferase